MGGGGPNDPPLGYFVTVNSLVVRGLNNKEVMKLLRGPFQPPPPPPPPYSFETKKPSLDMVKVVLQVLCDIMMRFNMLCYSCIWYL